MKKMYIAVLDEVIVDTRTQFYGDWRKKSGGILAEMNAKLSESAQLTAEDFEYVDIQTPLP